MFCGTTTGAADEELEATGSEATDDTEAGTEDSEEASEDVGTGTEDSVVASEDDGVLLTTLLSLLAGSSESGVPQPLRKAVNSAALESDKQWCNHLVDACFIIMSCLVKRIFASLRCALYF